MYSSTIGSPAAASAAAAAAARPSAPPAPLPLSYKKQIASFYRDFASFPVLASALFTSPQSRDRVTTALSQRDLAVDTFRKWTQTHIFDPNSVAGDLTVPTFEPLSYPTEVTAAGVVSSTPSPSGRLLAVIRTSEKRSALAPGGAAPAPAPPGPNLAPAGNRAYWLDVLTRRGVLCSIPLDAAHGRVYAGVPFGGLVWSKEEDAVAYAAEPHPPARRSLFDGVGHGPEAKPAPAHLAASAADGNGNGSGDGKDSGSAATAMAEAEADALAGTGSDYCADWGEQLTTIVSPALYMVDIAARCVVKVPGVPPASLLSAANPVWTYPNSAPGSSDSEQTATATGTEAVARGLTFIGYPVTPRRFGLIYYNSRPSQAYFVPVPPVGHIAALALKPASSSKKDGNTDASATAKTETTAASAGITAVCLTPHNATVNALSFAHDFSVLAYTTSSLSGDDAPFHCTTSALCAIDWPRSLSSLLPSPSERERAVVAAPPVGPTQAGSWFPALAPAANLPNSAANDSCVNASVARALIPIPTAISAAAAAAAAPFPVPAPVALRDSEFPGLYPGAWDPESPTLWAAPGVVAMDTMWRSAQTLIFVDTQCGGSKSESKTPRARMTRLSFDAASLPAGFTVTDAALRSQLNTRGSASFVAAESAPSVTVCDVIPATTNDAPASSSSSSSSNVASLLLSLSLPHRTPVLFRLTLTAAQLRSATDKAAAAAAASASGSVSVSGADAEGYYTCPVGSVVTNGADAAATSVPHVEVTMGALVAAGARWERVTVSSLEAAALAVAEGGLSETAALAPTVAALSDSNSSSSSVFYSPSLSRPLPVAAAVAAHLAGAPPRVAVPDTEAWAAVVAATASVTLQVPHKHACNRAYPGVVGAVTAATAAAAGDDAQPHFEALLSVHPGRFAAAAATLNGGSNSKTEKTESVSASAPPCRGIVLFPHGGPHSAFTTGYDFATTFLAALGLAVVRPNFRGSVGFGQDSLTALPGACGEVDVDDCVAAYDSACDYLDATLLQQQQNNDSSGSSSKARSLPVFLFGGSHGGYLVTHLAGQFPGKFAAVVARNAVINLTYTVTTSDIMDWCFTEGGVRFDPRYTLTAPDIQRLWEVSPLAHAAAYVTPTMLAVGTSDRRVPPEQSVDLFKLLQAKGVPSRLVVYQGAQHGLNDKPLIHADSMVSAALWFAQFGAATTR